MLGRCIPLVVVLASCDGVFGIVSVRELDDSLPADDATSGDIDATGMAMLVDGFEGAADARWTTSFENGDTCVPSTDQAMTGSYSLRCQTDGTSGSRAALVYSFAPTQTLRVQMDVRFTSFPQTWLTFLQTLSVTQVQSKRLVNSDFYPTSQIDVWNYETQHYAYHPATIALDTWYHVDFAAQMSASNGSVTLGIDGGAPVELVESTSDQAINQLQIGITLVTGVIEQHTVYIDNVVVTEL